MNGSTSSGMTGTDWIGVIMASNEAALRWAQLFTGREIPGEEDGITVTPERVGIGQNGLILIGLLALGAFLLLKD